MKSKCSFILKAGLSLVLVLLLLFSTMATGIAAVVEDLAVTGYDSATNFTIHGEFNGVKYWTNEAPYGTFDSDGIFSYVSTVSGTDYLRIQRLGWSSYYYAQADDDKDITSYIATGDWFYGQSNWGTQKPFKYTTVAGRKYVVKLENNYSEGEGKNLVAFTVYYAFRAGSYYLDTNSQWTINAGDKIYACLVCNKGQYSGGTNRSQIIEATEFGGVGSGVYSFDLPEDTNFTHIVWVRATTTFDGSDWSGSVVGNRTSGDIAYNGTAVTYTLTSSSAASTSATAPATNTVNFVSNDFGVDVPSQAIITGKKAYDPGTTNMSGYTFGGWYDNADLSGDAWTFASDTVSGNTTLYAKWTYTGTNYSARQNMNIYLDIDLDTALTATLDDDVKVQFRFYNRSGEAYGYGEWVDAGTAKHHSGDPIPGLTYSPVPANGYSLVQARVYNTTDDPTVDFITPIYSIEDITTNTITVSSTGVCPAGLALPLSNSGSRANKKGGVSALYFDNTMTGWNVASGYHICFFIGRPGTESSAGSGYTTSDAYQAVYQMTKVTNTKELYFLNKIAEWDNYTYFGFALVADTVFTAGLNGSYNPQNASKGVLTQAAAYTTISCMYDLAPLKEKEGSGSTTAADKTFIGEGEASGAVDMLWISDNVLSADDGAHPDEYLNRGVHVVVEYALTPGAEASCSAAVSGYKATTRGASVGSNAGITATNLSAGQAYFCRSSEVTVTVSAPPAGTVLAALLIDGVDHVNDVDNNNKYTFVLPGGDDHGSAPIEVVVKYLVAGTYNFKYENKLGQDVTYTVPWYLNAQEVAGYSGNGGRSNTPTYIWDVNAEAYYGTQNPLIKILNDAGLFSNPVDSKNTSWANVDLSVAPANLTTAGITLGDKSVTLKATTSDVNYTFNYVRKSASNNELINTSVSVTNGKVVTFNPLYDGSSEYQYVSGFSDTYDGGSFSYWSLDAPGTQILTKNKNFGLRLTSNFAVGNVITVYAQYGKAITGDPWKPLIEGAKVSRTATSESTNKQTIDYMANYLSVDDIIVQEAIGTTDIQYGIVVVETDSEQTKFDTYAAMKTIVDKMNERTLDAAYADKDQNGIAYRFHYEDADHISNFNRTLYNFTKTYTSGKKYIAMVYIVVGGTTYYSAINTDVNNA